MALAAGRWPGSIAVRWTEEPGATGRIRCCLGFDVMAGAPSACVVTRGKARHGARRTRQMNGGGSPKEYPALRSGLVPVSAGNTSETADALHPEARPFRRGAGGRHDDLQKVVERAILEVLGTSLRIEPGDPGKRPPWFLKMRARSRISSFCRTSVWPPRCEVFRCSASRSARTLFAAKTIASTGGGGPLPHSKSSRIFRLSSESPA